MKKIVLPAACIIAACLAFTFMSFKTTSVKNYEHMIIITEGVHLQRVIISNDGKNYTENKKLDKETEGQWDVNPVINLVHQYENEGWALQSITPNNATVLYWLKREK